ncbi:MAG: glycosyltransferase, partial [Microcoleus sp.]
QPESNLSDRTAFDRPNFTVSADVMEIEQESQRLQATVQQPESNLSDRTAFDRPNFTVPADVMEIEQESPQPQATVQQPESNLSDRTAFDRPNFTVPTDVMEIEQENQWLQATVQKPEANLLDRTAFDRPNFTVPTDVMEIEQENQWQQATVQQPEANLSDRTAFDRPSFTVSAIVSAYNSEKFMRGCLQDLVDQTLYKNGELEIIVLDSGSQENEQSIVREFQTQYPNIIYDRAPDRETLYAAWNRGIKMSRGAYITNANTDDRHRPDALEILAKYLDENPAVSLVYADQLITDRVNDTFATTQADRRWNWPAFDYNELERRCIIGPQPMWRKSLHETHGYFRSEFTAAGDYEFWLRVGKTEKFARLPEILGLYFANPQGLELSSSISQQETWQIWSEFGIRQRGIIPTASRPIAISASQLNSLPDRADSDSRPIAISASQLNSLPDRADSHSRSRSISDSQLNALSDRADSQPLVSIIIPCYNYAQYLAEAVASAVSQTYQNWECIIVNDGSPDDTSAVAKQIIQTDNRQHKIKLLEKPNGGIADARNAGISQAAGKYILCLDADDRIHPEFLAATVKILEEKPAVGFAYTDIQEFGVKQDKVSKGDFDLQRFLRSNQAPVTSLFRKEIFERVGGFNKIMVKGWEDWEFWVSACEKGWTGFRLAQPYLYYRQHATGSRQQTIHSSQLLQALHNALIITLHSKLYAEREVLWARQILLQGGRELGADTNRLISQLLNAVHPENVPELSPMLTSNPIAYPSINPAAAGSHRPFWSVMLPTYNPKPHYLEQTLNSILAQAPNSDAMQIEVVDDCSTDAGVAELVRNIGGGRISFYRQPQNLGQVANWNDCIDRARGHWVHILHQDDIVLPGFYSSLQTALAKQQNVGAAFCRHYYIDAGGNRRFVSESERETAGILDDFLDRIAVSQRIQFAAIAVRRDTYETWGGFCPQAASAADWEMWKRIASRCKIWYEPQFLACFRLHSASETSRLMQSGGNIADARKAIEISQTYLPPMVAVELSDRAREHYAIEALKMAQVMLQRGEESYANAQIQAALQCSKSARVMNSLATIFPSGKSAELLTRNGEQDKVMVQEKSIEPMANLVPDDRIMARETTAIEPMANLVADDRIMARETTAIEPMANLNADDRIMVGETTAIESMANLNPDDRIMVGETTAIEPMANLNADDRIMVGGKAIELVANLVPDDRIMVKEKAIEQTANPVPGPRITVVRKAIEQTANLVPDDRPSVLPLAAERETPKTSPKIIIDGVMFQIHTSGITRVWNALITEWASQSFGQQIVVLDRNGTAPKVPGIQYRQVPAYNYNNTEADREMLQEACDRERADLFISTYYTTPKSTRSVFAAYDMIPEVTGADLTKPMWREKHFAIRHAAACIAISENTARDLIKYFPKISPNSITVAHCGVDKGFSPATATEIDRFKAKYGITKPYFLWVGDRSGFNGYKNAGFFFKACAQLSGEGEFEIVCVGGNSVLESELQNYAAKIQVHLVKLSDAELRSAYSGAVTFVQTSKYEGFGLPILEAMACGCPVIAIPNSSIPEVAGEAALYVKDNNVKSLVNALIDVQKPDVRNSLIAAGFGRARKFSWSKMAKTVSAALIKAWDDRPQVPQANLQFTSQQPPQSTLQATLQQI